MKKAPLLLTLTTMMVTVQSTLAQATETVAGTTDAPAAGGFGKSGLIMMAVMFAILWFFMIRPEQKKQKNKEAMRKEIGKGDKVITIGGICGTIVKEIDNRFVLQMDKANQITILKAAVDRLDEGDDDTVVAAEEKK